MLVMTTRMRRSFMLFLCKDDGRDEFAPRQRLKERRASQMPSEHFLSMRGLAGGIAVANRNATTTGRRFGHGTPNILCFLAVFS